MSSFGRLLSTIIALTLMVVITPSASAKKLLSDVTLYWKPTSAATAKPIDVSNLQGKKILIGAFTDNRTNSHLIAENREDESEGTVLPVTTTTDIPAWVGTHLADQLEQIGLTTVTSAADFILDGTVEKFFVLETDSYRAKVSVHLRLTDKAGTVVWDTTLTANESRAGRSYKLENYAEVLSDAVKNLALAIVRSPDFQTALTQN